LRSTLSAARRRSSRLNKFGLPTLHSPLFSSVSAAAQTIRGDPQISALKLQTARLYRIRATTMRSSLSPYPIPLCCCKMVDNELSRPDLGTYPQPMCSILRHLTSVINIWQGQVDSELPNLYLLVIFLSSLLFQGDPSSFLKSRTYLRSRLRFPLAMFWSLRLDRLSVIDPLPFSVLLSSLCYYKQTNKG
jgi:hypothetical protein